MRNLVRISICAVMLFGCRKHQGGSFNSEIEALFFGVDLNRSYDRSLSYFQSIKQLEETDPGGWVVYPPLSALGQAEWINHRRLFLFDRHHILPGESIEGQIDIDTEKDVKALPEISILFHFESSQKATEMFNTLHRKFSTLAAERSDNDFLNSKTAIFVNPNRGDTDILLRLDDYSSYNDGYNVSLKLIRRKY